MSIIDVKPIILINSYIFQNLPIRKMSQHKSVAQEMKEEENEITMKEEKNEIT